MRFAFVLLLGLCVGGSASGGPPRSLDIDNGYRFRQSTRWIEQQDDWPQPPDAEAILRPDGFQCVWAVDDHADWSYLGNIEAGASTSRTDCIVSDFNPVFATRFGTTASWSNAPYGFAGLLVRAPSASLSVSVCYEPQGRCFNAGPVWDEAFRSYAYKFCGRASYTQDDLALTDVAGSNGGRGVLTSVTLTITNPTGKRVRNVRADGGFSSDVFFPKGCDGASQANHDYPFSWTSS